MNRTVAWSVLLLAGLGPPRLAAQPAPEQVVAAFCDRDGHGDRLRPGAWAGVGVLVAWPLEPAWDRILVVSGYEIQPTGGAYEDDSRVVRVDYSVLAEVSAAGVTESLRREEVQLRLSMESGTWRIQGPPPWPHVFDSVVDREAMAASLRPGRGRFVSNSAFVWRAIRDAGRDLAYHPVAQLLAAESLREVSEVRTGDLVIFLRGGVPYHAGIYEGAGRLVSATINAGIARSGLDAFGTGRRYLRWIGTEPGPPTVGPPAIAAPEAPEGPPAPQPAATAGVEGAEPPANTGDQPGLHDVPPPEED